MGRVGACGDNAAMESFFALLQKNMLDRRRWATRDDLRLAIVTWIEATYHRRRQQAPLGRLTPIEGASALYRRRVAAHAGGGKQCGRHRTGSQPGDLAGDAETIRGGHDAEQRG
jgi:hypothetical protein